MSSRPRSRTSRGSTRSTITPTGRPGWTSCSASWRSAALRSHSVRPFPRTLSTCTSCTCTPRIGEGSLRYNNDHLQYTTQILATAVCTKIFSKYVRIGWVESKQTIVQAILPCINLLTPHLFLYVLIRVSQIWVVFHSITVRCTLDNLALWRHWQ